MLSIAEELLLIALDDATGCWHTMPDRALDYGLAGAVLGEGWLRGEIELESGEQVRLTSSRVLREALGSCESAQLNEGSRQFVLRSLLAELAHHGAKLRQRHLEGLCRKGILVERDDRFFWVFHRRRYPVVDDREEVEVTRRLRDGILRGAELDRRDQTLAALMDACRLTSVVFSEEEMEQAHARIEPMVNANCFVRVVRESLEQIHLAVMEIRAYAGMG